MFSKIFRKIFQHFKINLKTTKSMQRHRKNQSYKFGCLRLEIDELFPDSLTKDRDYMRNQMKNHFDYLDQHGIYEYQNFAKTLHVYMRTGEIQKLIQSFVDYKNTKSLGKRLFLLKPRELKKANICEINILLNRIALEYSNEFLTFFENYLKLYYPLMKIRSVLVQTFKNNIDHLITIEKAYRQEKIILNNNSSQISIPIEHENISNDDFFIYKNKHPKRIICKKIYRSKYE